MRERRRFLKILGLGLICCLLAVSAQAFVYEVNILTKDEISKLSDAKLAEAYIDVLVEFEASKTFYQRAGFTPKEYNKHKNLVRYRVYLYLELQKRKLSIPDVGF